MSKERLPISGRRTLDRLVSYGMKAPAGIESMPIHFVIKILRQGLGMTQAQLARRAKLAQSHVARIELGRFDFQLSTLQKIFQALGCNVLVFPRFKKKIAEIIAERARETAIKKIARVSGTMALEKQLPDQKMTRELIRGEAERLENSRSSEIWEE